MSSGTSHITLCLLDGTIIRARIMHPDMYIRIIKDGGRVFWSPLTPIPDKYHDGFGFRFPEGSIMSITIAPSND